MENQDQIAGSWSRTRQWAFRFVFVYLVLYNLPFPFGILPHTVRVAQVYESLWLKLIPWVGKHVLQLSYEIATPPICSGDTTYDYVRLLCYLGFAFVVSVFWSFLDRSHSRYPRLHEWLRLYVRLSLGAALLTYGAAKVFVVHFPPPNLYKLLRPLGDYSAMSLLWTLMGTSRGYTVFSGCWQMLGGVLLFVPRFVTVGTLVIFAIFSNIFAMNLGYDLPLKLYSFHVLLLCSFLVLPDVRRLFHFFLLNRSVAPSSEMGLFDRPHWNRAISLAQVTFGGFLVCLLLYQAHDHEKRTFGTASKPPFYGIWTVDEFTLGGKVLPPLGTDEVRWQRVVFQFRDKVGIQIMNGSWTDYWLREDLPSRALAIGSPSDPKPAFQFTFSNPDSRSLVFEGRAGESTVRMNLHRVDEKQFALVAAGFHWIDEEAGWVMDEEQLCDRGKRPEQALSLWR